jgi:hypothetical protein
MKNDIRVHGWKKGESSPSRVAQHAFTFIIKSFPINSSQETSSSVSAFGTVSFFGISSAVDIDGASSFFSGMSSNDTMVYCTVLVDLYDTVEGEEASEKH